MVLFGAAGGHLSLAPPQSFIRSAKTKFVHIWGIGIQMHASCVLNI